MGRPKAFMRARMDAIKATLPSGTIWLDYLKEYRHEYSIVLDCTLIYFWDEGSNLKCEQLHYE